MPQLVESIHLIDGKMPLLALHQDRVDRSRIALFPEAQPIKLESYINIGPFAKSGEFKCRVVYDQEIKEISIQSYNRKMITSCRLLETSDLVYSYKYLDRTKLDKLYNQKAESDEIIIVNNGYISDAYYYNLCFWDGTHWYTPSDNLLDGVMRAQLLEEEKIIAKSLTISDLSNFQKVSFINALNGLGQIELPIDCIV